MKVGTFLGNWVERERRPDAILQVIGLDPCHWQLADLSLWPERPQPVDLGHSYSLVHVSLPEAEESDASLF